MIEISLTTALMFYSCLLGVFVLGIWAYTEISVRRSYYVLEKQFLWRCVFCGYTYLDEDAEKISQCPRCDSFNSAEDRRAKFVRVAVADDAAAELQQAQRNSSHRKKPHQRTRGPRRSSR
jgi:hypothetical protein